MWPLSESWGTQVVTCVTFLTNYLFVLMLNVPFIICFSASVTYATKSYTKKQNKQTWRKITPQLRLDSIDKTTAQRKAWTRLWDNEIHWLQHRAGAGTKAVSWRWRAQLLVAFRRGADTGALWKGRFTCAGLLSCHIVIPDVTEPLAAGSLLLSALLALLGPSVRPPVCVTSVKNTRWRARCSVCLTFYYLKTNKEKKKDYLWYLFLRRSSGGTVLNYCIHLKAYISYCLGLVMILLILWLI